MEVVVPVRVFDNHLHLGIDSLGRLHHQFTTSVSHESEPIVRPTLVTLGGYLVIVLQVDEEEIVEDKVIKEPGCIFRYLLHLLPFLLSCITIGLEIRGLRASEGDTATHFKTFLQEEFLHFEKGLLRNGVSITVCLDINLVEVHLTTHCLPGRLKELVILHPCHILCPDIGRHLEVLILSCLNGCYSQQGCCKKNAFKMVVFHICKS